VLRDLAKGRRLDASAERVLFVDDTIQSPTSVDAAAELLVRLDGADEVTAVSEQGWPQCVHGDAAGLAAGVRKRSFPATRCRPP
jgi:hypothetical protein